jgi:hypothetical protein
MMGLDAVVYRDMTNVDLGKDRGAAKVDPRTGEVYFQDEEISRKYQSKLTAVEFRLGSIAVAAALCSEITQLLGPTTCICKEVLYSGSHSGDVIPINGMAALITEIVDIRRSSKASPDLLLFLEKLEKLIDNANVERNPIVFV